jgi:hypothetical protein
MIVGNGKPGALGTVQTTLGRARGKYGEVNGILRDAATSGP